MDQNFAAVAIFTLLFAVFTARISLDLTPADLQVERSNVRIQSDCKVEDSDLAVVPTDTKKSRSRHSPMFRPHPSSPAFSKSVDLQMQMEGIKSSSNTRDVGMLPWGSITLCGIHSQMWHMGPEGKVGVKCGMCLIQDHWKVEVHTLHVKETDGLALLYTKGYIAISHTLQIFTKHGTTKFSGFTELYPLSFNISKGTRND
ncbi:hypothetical protein L1987_30374 [Smallanthus sonchifolius]|uniref:Uncharacterized protein n=1 Tax=Smallanthus sonchifolius TaxID=185202 RepID=A0ACB9I2K4_9ASTR|nr:hypothetical protein L1987_30374 [Smallanthus sonchifolius]